MLHVPGIYIATIEGKGRGVFCAHDLEIGDIIEVCPIIKIPTGQLSKIDSTIFYEYYFIWEETRFEACIALGYGSLYNHSKVENVEVILDYNTDEIIFKAIEPISGGTELCINYHVGVLPRDERKLWFQDKG